MTGVSTSCGACKFLRRKCTSECVFGPYFSYDEAAIHFSAVHKVFGASNVSRLLLHLPEQHRREAALSISYEALARMQDPVYGCVAYIYALQQEVAYLQEEIDVLGNHMANLSTGATNDYCGNSQATNYNNPMNNNSLLQFSSQEGPMNLPEYWNTMINFQQEQVVPAHAENGSGCNNPILSNQTSLLQPQQISLCEWDLEGVLNQNLSGNNSDPNHFDKVVEEVLNQEFFDYHPWSLTQLYTT